MFIAVYKQNCRIIIKKVKQRNQKAETKRNATALPQRANLHFLFVLSI